MNDQNFDSTKSSEIKVKEKKRNPTSVIFVIATVLLLGAGIYLFADNTSKARTNETLNTELTESANRYADLDAKYTSALADIESYKGKNAELDSVLSVKEKYILDLKANLSKEKKQRNISDADYKLQLDNLNNVVADLNTQVEQLQNENKILVVQKDSLGRNLVQTQVQVTQLQSTNSVLTQKVTIASLLIPKTISVTGGFDKSSGKGAETKSAKKSERLNICFALPENKVAEDGEKLFYIQILGPGGTPLAIQDQGSGVITLASGEQKQYTTTASVDYQQAEKNVCTHWNQTMPFVAGTYTAEIYQDGYLVGKTQFELK